MDVPAGNGALDVAAGLRCEVYDDRSGAHTLHHFTGHQERGTPPGDGRRRDQYIGIGDVRCQQLPLQGAAVGAELAGVPAGRLRSLQVEFDKSAAHGRDLFRGGRTDVVGGDAGAEPFGRPDRLQASHADAEHQHPCGRDGSGSGHVQREETGKADGGFEDAAVAGHEGLRG